jgi:hypothetical protein
LSRGEALPEEVASQILHDKIDSPEVAHHGLCFIKNNDHS